MGPNMKLNADTVFYHIWYSIRGDWSDGVIHRLQILLDLLPQTSIKDKPKMKDWLTYCKDEWGNDIEDGRTVARDGYIEFWKLHTLFSRQADLDVNWNHHKEDQDIYTAILDEFGGCSDDAIELYEEYQRKKAPEGSP